MKVEQWDFYESTREGLFCMCYTGRITKLLQWDYYERVRVELLRKCYSGIITNVLEWNYYESVTLGLLRNCYSMIRKVYISVSQVNGSGMQYSVMFITHPKLPFCNYSSKSGHQHSESGLYWDFQKGR